MRQNALGVGDAARPLAARGSPPDGVPPTGGGGVRPRPTRRRRGPRQLYTATLGLVADGSAYIVFHASMATSPIVVRRRLVRHVGAFGATMCRIRRGYDAEHAIARALVTSRLADLLARIEIDPTCERARGLYVHHVERVGVSA